MKYLFQILLIVIVILLLSSIAFATGGGGRGSRFVPEPALLSLLAALVIPFAFFLKKKLKK